MADLGSNFEIYVPPTEETIQSLFMSGSLNLENSNFQVYVPPVEEPIQSLFMSGSIQLGVQFEMYNSAPPAPPRESWSTT